MAVLSKKQMSEEDIKDDLLITCIGGSIGWSWIEMRASFITKMVMLLRLIRTTLFILNSYIIG